MEEAKNKSADFAKITLDALPEKIGKQDLADALKKHWFKSYELRMAITGKKIVNPDADQTTEENQ